MVLFLKTEGAIDHNLPVERGLYTLCFLESFESLSGAESALKLILIC